MKKDEMRAIFERRDLDPAWRGQVELGAGLYARHCASCHGASLEGQPNWRQRLADGSYPAPPHDVTGHTWHHPDSYLFATVKLGGQATAPPGVRSRMPAFASRLSTTRFTRC